MTLENLQENLSTLLDKACYENKTSYNRIKSLTSFSNYYPNFLPKLPKEQEPLLYAYQLIDTASIQPFLNDIDTYNKENKTELQITKDILPMVKTWADKKEKEQSYPSSKFPSSLDTPVFELDDYFVKIVTPKQKPFIGENQNGKRKNTENSLHFLLKDHNMTVSDYQKLNEEGQSFHAIIKGQFCRNTPNQYFVKTLTSEREAEERYTPPLMVSPYPQPSKNEYYNLIKEIEHMQKNNELEKPAYIGIPTTPYKEYVLHPNSEFSIHCLNTLSNGKGKDPETNTEITDKNYREKGFLVLSQQDFHKKIFENTNQHCNKWEEISEKEYHIVQNTSEPQKKLFNGFFLNENILPNTAKYYQSFKDEQSGTTRYFTSLQQLDTPWESIYKNLESHMSRAVPRDKFLKNLKETVQDHYFKHETEYPAKTKKILDEFYHKNASTYVEQSSSDKEITNLFKRFNIIPQKDKTSKTPNVYHVNLDLVHATGIHQNKYDTFMYNHIQDITFETSNVTSNSQNNSYTEKKIEKCLAEMTALGFTGKHLPEFAKDYVKHQTDIENSKTGSESFFRNNTAKYALTLPTLQDINRFAASKGYPIEPPKTTVQKSPLLQKHKGIKV